MRVSIVGAGIAGLSLAWALVRRGAEVALFEQGDIPNPVSSSHDEHRITRHSYGGLFGYGALMPLAFETMRRSGRTSASATSIPRHSSISTDWPAATARELDAAGIRHRPLSLAALAEAVPMIRAAGVVEAYEAEGAGELFAARFVTSLAAWLKEAGVVLHPRTRVREVDPQSGRLVTDRGVFDADDVVAAGAWVLDLVPAAAARLTPSRQTVLYLKPPERLAAAWRATTIIVDTGLSHGAYVLPPREGTRLKSGDHVFTRQGHGGDDRLASWATSRPSRRRRAIASSISTTTGCSRPRSATTR